MPLFQLYITNESKRRKGSVMLSSSPEQIAYNKGLAKVIQLNRPRKASRYTPARNQRLLLLILQGAKKTKIVCPGDNSIMFERSIILNREIQQLSIKGYGSQGKKSKSVHIKCNSISK